MVSFKLLLLAVAASCIGWVSSTVFAATVKDNAPTGVKIEAESCKAGGSEVIDDEAASGGSAVQMKNEWQPIIVADVPAGDSPQLTLWVRHKGGPFQLKCIVDGKQNERDWVWAKPDQWSWTRVGRYGRVELGQQVLLMHGAGQDMVRLDELVFSPDADAHPEGMKSDGGRELPPQSPSVSAEATSATVTVQWNQSIGRIGPMLWGLNDYEICTPQDAADGKYAALLHQIRPGLVRVHWAGMPNAWTDQKTKDWDAAKIKSGFDALAPGYGDAKLMLNIPWWPDWIATPKDGVLPEANEDEFVRLVGRLVLVMKTQVRRPVAYWELLNERDDTYAKAGKLDQLWRLHNKLYAEIKRQDPAAKVGGAAFTWPNPTWVEPFLKTCGPNIDFVSWHNYASGDPYTSNDELFNLADVIGAHAADVKASIAKLLNGRQVETFLTEYNVQWNWEPYERRHGNNVGAIFDACVINRMAKLGVSGATVWHAKGHAFGLIDGDDTLRPPGVLFTWGRAYLTGDLSAVATGDIHSVDAMAVSRQDGTRSLLLMNKTNHDIRVQADAVALLGLTPDATITIARITADHADRSPASAMQNAMTTLPGYSLTLLTNSKAPVR